MALISDKAGKSLEDAIKLKTEDGTLVWKTQERMASWGPINIFHQCRQGDYTIDTWSTTCDGVTIQLQEIEYVGEPPHGKDKKSQVLILNTREENLDFVNSHWFQKPDNNSHIVVEHHSTTLSDLVDSLKQKDSKQNQKIKEQETNQQKQKIRTCLDTLGVVDPEILNLF
jgi:hypothetical protein